MILERRLERPVAYGRVFASVAWRCQIYVVNFLHLDWRSGGFEFDSYTVGTIPVLSCF